MPLRGGLEEGTAGGAAAGLAGVHEVALSVGVGDGLDDAVGIGHASGLRALAEVSVDREWG